MSERFISNLTKGVGVITILVWFFAGYLFLSLQQKKAKIEKKQPTSAEKEKILNVSPTSSISSSSGKTITKAFSSQTPKEKWLNYQSKFGYSFSYPPEFKIIEDGEVPPNIRDRVRIVATVLQKAQAIITFEVVNKTLNLIYAELLEKRVGAKLNSRITTTSGKRAAYVLYTPPPLLPMTFLYELDSQKTLKVVAVPKQDLDYHLIELQIINSLNFQ